jgi:hypothetical protein
LSESPDLCFGMMAVVLHDKGISTVHNDLLLLRPPNYQELFITTAGAGSRNDCEFGSALTAFSLRSLLTSSN